MAEVRSRFEGEKGGVERFLEVARRLGFDKMKMDQTNKMFLLAEFRKSSRTPEEGVTFEAKVRGRGGGEIFERYRMGFIGDGCDCLRF